jgi:hypothetical protein
MTVEDLQTYLATYLNPFIAARSTGTVPLAPIVPDQVYAYEYELPAKNCTIFIDAAPEEFEDLTMSTRDARLPVTVIVFVQGATEAQLRARARGYMYAVLDCIADHPDFMRIESRDAFEGVEGKPDIKAGKVLAIFQYEEAI